MSPTMHSTVQESSMTQSRFAAGERINSEATTNNNIKVNDNNNNDDDDGNNHSNGRNYNNNSSVNDDGDDASISQAACKGASRMHDC
jgi:hypothetical protein